MSEGAQQLPVKASVDKSSTHENIEAFLKHLHVQLGVATLLVIVLTIWKYTFLVWSAAGLLLVAVSLSIFNRILPGSSDIRPLWAVVALVLKIVLTFLLFALALHAGETELFSILGGYFLGISLALVAALRLSVLSTGKEQRSHRGP